MPITEEMIREKLKEADKSDIIGISLVKREGAPEDDITIFQKPAGMNATMLKFDEWKKTKTVQVQFEDGTKVDGTLCDFMNGLLHKTGSVILRDEEAMATRTGIWMLMDCLHFAKITEYNNSADIRVAFEDGVPSVSDKVKFFKFCRGEVKHPTYNGRKEKRIFEYLNKKWIMQNCGMAAQMIGYVDSYHIKVRFEDGSVKDNVTFYMFQNGQVYNPSLYYNGAVDSYVFSGNKNHIGDKVILSCGVLATVIGRTKNMRGRGTKLTIQLEDSNKTIINDVNFSSFKRGTVAVPGINTQAKVKADNLVGKTQHFPFYYEGMDGKIIRYDNRNCVYVKFDNGNVEVMRISQFESGRFFSTPKRNDYHSMIGMKKRMHCGYVAEIVGVGTKSGTIDLLFHIPGIPSEMCIYRNADYQKYKNGGIGLPKCCPAKRTPGKSMREMYYTCFILPQIKGSSFIWNDRTILGKNLELDAIDMNTMQAFEYNGGYWHQKEKAIKRDEIKVQLCEKKGIRLIRIFDSSFNENANFHRSDDIFLEEETYSKIEKTAKLLLEKLVPVYNFRVDDINVSYHDFLQWYDNLSCDYAFDYFQTKYVGQTRVMKSGQIVECIGYKSSRRADFRFLNDGAEVYDRTWHSFVTGQLTHPDVLLPNRLNGKIFTMNKGDAIGVIATINNKDIWVINKDGVIRTHVSHQSIKNGSVETNINSNGFKRVSKDFIMGIDDLESEKHRQLATHLVAELQRRDKTA